MNPPPTLTPLAQANLKIREYDGEELHMFERPGLTLVTVHSLLDLPARTPALARWPDRTGRCLEDGAAVLCLRPRQWLCIHEDVAPATVIDRLEQLIDPATTAVHDCSDSYAVFGLDGASAPWLLAKLSGLDFLSGAADGPHCARTRMGHAAVVVHCRGASGNAFDLIVDRSQARYLWELMVDAAPHATQLARTGWNAA